MPNEGVDTYHPATFLCVNVAQRDSFGMPTSVTFGPEPDKAVLETIKYAVRLGLQLGLGDAVDMAIIQARQRHEEMNTAREAYKRHRSLPPLETLIDAFKDAPPEVEVCGAPTAKT